MSLPITKKMLRIARAAHVIAAANLEFEQLGAALLAVDRIMKSETTTRTQSDVATEIERAGSKMNGAL